MMRDILVHLLDETKTMKRVISIFHILKAKDTSSITIDPLFDKPVFSRQPVIQNLPETNDTSRRCLIIASQSTPRRLRTIRKPINISTPHTIFSIHNPFVKLIQINHVPHTLNDTS